MASAVLMLLRIIFLLLCTSSVVNEKSVFERKVNENNFTSDLSKGMHALKVMSQSTLMTAQWSHIALLIKVSIAIYFLVYQLCDIVNKGRELEAIDEHNTSVKHKVGSVDQFYEGTEIQFGKINSKSAGVLEWFKTMESTNITIDHDLNDNLAFLRKSFYKQQSIFSKYELNLDEKPITFFDIRAQLTMANGFVGKTIRNIEAEVAEDLLTIGDIKKDVRSLNAYFRKRSK